MKPSRKIVAAVAGVLVVVALLLVFGRDLWKGGAPSARGIAVGAILPLSGENASFGTTARSAFEIAQADAAAAGRAAVTIVYGDSQLDKDKALAQWRRLVQQEKVVAFTEVTGSGVALALAGIAEKDQVPMVSGINTSPALTKEGGRYFFRVIPSDAYSGKVLSKWAVEGGLTKGALVFNQQNDWAVGFRTAVTEAYPAAGGAFGEGLTLTVTNDTVDFGPAIATIRKGQPQAVFVGLMGRQAGLFVAQAVDKGLTGPFFGVDNLAQQEFVEAAGAAATRARMVLPSESVSPAAQEFARKFRAKTGRDADAIAFKAYDAYMVLLTAIEGVAKGGKDVTGAAIRDALASTRIQGITGPIAFDANNDLAEADYSRFTFGSDGSRVAVE